MALLFSDFILFERILLLKPSFEDNQKMYLVLSEFFEFNLETNFNCLQK